MNQYLSNRRVTEELLTDMTITLTSAMSVAEMQARMDQAPRYLRANLTIQFSDGTYVPADGTTLNFGGFSGNGTLTIQGNAVESGLHTNQAVIFTLGISHSATGFGITACSCPIILKNIRFNRSCSASTFYVTVLPMSCYDMSISGCCFDSQNQACYGMLASFSNVYFYNNYCGAHEVAAFAYSCSNMLAWDNDDIGSSDKPTWAYGTQVAGSLAYYGTSPATGSGSIDTTSNGGRKWV